MLRFRDLGVFVFEFWVLRFQSRVLRFRVLGASSFGLRFRVLRFGNYQVDPPFDHEVNRLWNVLAIRIFAKTRLLHPITGWFVPRSSR